MPPIPPFMIKLSIDMTCGPMVCALTLMRKSAYLEVSRSLPLQPILGVCSACSGEGPLLWCGRPRELWMVFMGVFVEDDAEHPDEHVELRILMVSEHY